MSSQASAKQVPQLGPLREGLDREGLTVEEFAVEFGVASKTVFRWLHGISNPRRRHARKLAERFGGHWSDYASESVDPMEQVA